ncbi:MAG: squalene/phytoene synthase family protein [Pseudomonadota bacterium]|nr:squalene/phytoene synthase family protein [Pseudomonadota bacterium]
MDFADHCRERVAVPGSNYYYSTVFLPAERQSPLHVMFAFKEELTAIPRTCADPGVARLKLQWWRQELAAVFSGGRSAHPVATALAELAESAAPKIFAAIDAVEHDIGPLACPTFADLTAHFGRVYGGFWRIAAGIAGYDHPATPDRIADLGSAVDLSQSLQDLRIDATRGRAALPAAELSAHGIDPYDLSSPLTPRRLRPMLADHIERLRGLLSDGIARVPALDRMRQLNTLVMANLLLVILEEIKHDGYRVSEHRLGLTPVRKLLIAWRTKRRALRR